MKNVKIEKMKQTVTINYKGIELEIVGDYFEGDKETRDYPGSSSYFEASEILHSKENIFELFSWDDISKMEELVIEKLEE